jgi:hypothetical protein
VSVQSGQPFSTNQCFFIIFPLDAPVALETLLCMERADLWYRYPAASSPWSLSALSVMSAAPPEARSSTHWLISLPIAA